MATDLNLLATADSRCIDDGRNDDVPCDHPPTKHLGADFHRLSGYDVDAALQRHLLQIQKLMDDRLTSQYERLETLIRNCVHLESSNPEITAVHLQPMSPVNQGPDGDMQLDISHGTESSYYSMVQTFTAHENLQQSKALAIASAMLGNGRSLDQKRSAIRNRIEQIVLGNHFDIFTNVIIVTNLVFVAVQAEYMTSQTSDDIQSVLVALHYIYIILFTLELCLRIWAEGRKFLGSKRRAWNAFDATIVLFALIEVLMDLISQSGIATATTYIRMLRFVRALRILRAVRVMRAFRGLRILVHTILGTLKSLLWVICFIAIVIYIFCILFTQFLSEYLTPEYVAWQMRDSPDFQEVEKTLRQYFGSLPRSGFTLLKVVCNGIEWDVLAQAVGHTHWLLVLLFVVYIVFIHFSVLNIVTGVFCQNAIETAERDHESMIQNQLSSKEVYVKNLALLFKDIDVEGTGQITLTEFEKHLQDEHVTAYFASLGLEPSDAWTLFKLLDSQNQKAVNIRDFVDGCVRLKGTARSIDVAKLMYENKWIMKQLVELRTIRNSQKDKGGSAAVARRESTPQTRVQE